MRGFINPLLFWFAQASHGELVRQLQYLKVENQILRGKLGRYVRVTPRERQRLLRFGLAAGPAMRHLISIVTSRTWDRWVRGMKWPKGAKPRHSGRPRTPAEIEQLILRIARETDWGYTRVLGALKRLGITTVSRSTVVNILKRHGLEPGPARGPGTWDQFIRRHARTLWACDFLPRRVLTWRGWRDAYLLVFINLGTRRVWVGPSTLHPSWDWTANQATEFCRLHATDPNAPRILLRDRDTKFWGDFDHALRAEGVEPLVIQSLSPNMNAYAERVIQTIQHECLDHFVAFGTRHLDHLVKEFLEHYHTERPHQSLGNAPLKPAQDAPSRASPPPGFAGRLVCRERLGGLLRDYRWREAA